VLALGADVGGNATPIGASANVVGPGVAGRMGFKVSWGYYLMRAVPLPSWPWSFSTSTYCCATLRYGRRLAKTPDTAESAFHNTGFILRMAFTLFRSWGRLDWCQAQQLELCPQKRQLGPGSKTRWLIGADSPVPY
jgi:hypothetical protein